MGRSVAKCALVPLSSQREQGVWFVQAGVCPAPLGVAACSARWRATTDDVH